MSRRIHIIVCMKQVIDPEAPPASFKLDSGNMQLAAEGVPPVISPYDESALELALKIKDSQPNCSISVLSLGSKLARPVLMKALAVGADELHMIEGQAATDHHVIAAILASVISGMSFDIILTGRQAADTNSGAVGLSLAARLSLPAVSWVRKVNIEDDKLIVDRIIPDGYEVLRGSMPALVTVSHEAGSLRMPKLKDIKAAKDKPIYNLCVETLNPVPIPSPLTTLIRLESPLRERHCHLIEANDAVEATTKLAQAFFREAY